MPSSYQNCVSLLTADVSLPINATTDMDTAKLTVDVRHCKLRRLYIYAKGADAACALNLDCYFQVSPDGVNWHDIYVISVPLSGTSQVEDYNSCQALDLTDVNYIRLDRVKNNEAVAGRTASVNAFIAGGKIN